MKKEFGMYKHPKKNPPMKLDKIRGDEYFYRNLIPHNPSFADLANSPLTSIHNIRTKYMQAKTKLIRYTADTPRQYYWPPDS